MLSMSTATDRIPSSESVSDKSASQSASSDKSVNAMSDTSTSGTTTSATTTAATTTSGDTTPNICPCTIVKEYRYNCGHSILRKGGSHEKHPACLVSASGSFTQVGDVRRMVFIINNMNTDFENLTPDQCFQCRAEAEFRDKEPEANGTQVRTHARRAMHESGITQEHRFCDTLLSTSRGRTKAITKGKKGFILGRAKEQLEGRLFGSPKDARGRGPKASNDMVYWLAAEVLSLCEILGDSRLVSHFGRVIYLRCAVAIQQYLDDAIPDLARVFAAAVGPRLARREHSEGQKTKATGATKEIVNESVAAGDKQKQQAAQEKSEGGSQKARKTRRGRGKKSQQSTTQGATDKH